MILYIFSLWDIISKCVISNHFENHAFKKRIVMVLGLCVCGIVVGINMIVHDMYYYHSLKFVKAWLGH